MATVKKPTLSDAASFDVDALSLEQIQKQLAEKTQELAALQKGFDTLPLTYKEEISNSMTELQTAIEQLQAALQAKSVEPRDTAGKTEESGVGAQGGEEANKGGIDFNPELFDLQIKRDGKGVPLPLPMQNIQNLNIEGFFPVIINVAPVSIPLLLGFNENPADANEEVPQVSLNPGINLYLETQERFYVARERYLSA